MKYLKSTIVIWVLFGFLAIPILFSVGTLFNAFNKNNGAEFVRLTSYGFAIFAGICTMLFAWSRALEPADKKYIKILNNSAVNSLSCAILFLASNLINYVRTLPKSAFPLEGFYEFTRMYLFGLPVYIFIVCVELLTIDILISVIRAYIHFKIIYEESN